MGDDLKWADADWGRSLGNVGENLLWEEVFTH